MAASEYSLFATPTESLDLGEGDVETMESVCNVTADASRAGCSCACVRWRVARRIAGGEAEQSLKALADYRRSRHLPATRIANAAHRRRVPDRAVGNTAIEAHQRWRPKTGGAFASSKHVARVATGKHRL